MRESEFIISGNERIAEATFRMTLEGDTSAISGSGQFVQIAVDGCFLRRPISVSDCRDGVLTIVYKVVGKGTDAMSRLAAGDKLSLIAGLGKGFDPSKAEKTALLVGGSVGAAPLLLLARELVARGCRVYAALGFASSDAVFYEKELKALGAKVAVATDDGSYGVKGLVTEAIETLDSDYDYFYACGPKPMLKALCRTLDCPGEISMEERMGCGTGICYGCTCMTTSGPKRVCADGPVFKKEEMVW